MEFFLFGLFSFIIFRWRPGFDIIFSGVASGNVISFDKEKVKIKFDNGNIEEMEYKSGIETLHMILDGYCGYGRIGNVCIGDDTKDGYHKATDSELLDIGRAYDVFISFNEYSHYEDTYIDLTIYFTNRRDYPRNYYWLETGTIKGISDDILKEDNKNE